MAKTDSKVGQRIRQRREMLGWSKAQLGKIAGLHPSQIGRFESGERSLSEEHLWKISGALGWSPERFFSSDHNVMATGTDTRKVPLLDYIQAGQWTVVQEHLPSADELETVAVSMETPPSSFAMRVRGNSMEPLFLAGDIIVIAPTISPKPGDFVVATDENGEATFKKYRELGLNSEGRKIIELVALNPDYPAVRSDRQHIAIVGKMIRQIRDYDR